MHNWKTDCVYPITIEGREDKIAPWETIYHAETPNDLEFRMNSYQLRMFPLMRVRDGNGETRDVTQEGILNFHNEALRKIELDLEPLSAFTEHAPEEAMETAQELIDSGLASQHFHIRDRSRVLINHPNLHHLRFVEFDDSVVCRIFIHEGPPTDTEPSVTVWKDANRGFTVTPEVVTPEIGSFLVLLCATIVRDFWVLEERTRGREYQKRTEKTRRREGRGKDRKLVIEKDYIFIPRFQYDLASYADRQRTVAHQARITLSPHLVSGHLRKLPDGWKVSEQAKQHAAEFGIHLRDGHTFVRPHERGEIERLMIDLLRCLLSHKETGHSHRSTFGIAAEASHHDDRDRTTSAV